MKFAPSSLIRNDTFRGALRALADLAHPRAAEWRRQIEHAYLRGEWERVVEIVPQAMKASITLANPGNYLRLAQAQARLRLSVEAAQTLETGVSQYPWSQVLLRGAAELAMSQSKWSTALVYWQRALDAPEQEREARSRVRALPRRGTDFDWYELAWRRIVTGWDHWWQEAGVRPLPVTYSRVFKVLQVCGEAELASRIALLAFRDYPDNEGLLLQMLPSLADPKGFGGISSALEAAQRQMQVPIAEPLVRRLKSASALLEDLADWGPTPETGLRIVTVGSGSTYETVVRASNIWGEHRIRHATRRLAERDNWPERDAPTDRLSDAAWLAANRFARGRGIEVGVQDASLARAVFHFLKHELVLRLPVDRLAKEMIAESGDRPILIELKTLTLRYLVSYPGSPMQSFYLYDALRRLGANVQFVHFVHPPKKQKGLKRFRKMPLPAPILRAYPQVTELRPKRAELVDPPQRTSNLLVPSGIRSVTRVLDQLDEPPIVLNAGASLSEFAYDRTKMHRISYDIHKSLHPWAGFLPRFLFETEVQQTWERVDPDAARGRRGAARPDAWISTGTIDTSDWNQWLAEALFPYFSKMVENADELIEEHGITDAHIGDYLYAESSLVADRVRAHGGRVHLWPHSSNPVHVKFHDPAELASIHCVTESGARTWTEAAPTTRVVHEAGLMIPNQPELVSWEEGRPISLVVMGGRPVMRNLPILAIEKHEQAYRDFFTSLEPLVEAGKVKVYFKPRGLTGEHEAWLEEIVGRAADWKRELAHPMRLKLPNPVYASVSVGSSALLEGVARGIPGVIVREKLHVRDYISTRRGGLDTLDVAATIDLLESLSSREQWEAKRDAQRQELAEELGIAPPLRVAGVQDGRIETIN